MDSKVIPYGRQDINQNDIDAVVETLRSDWLTQGPAVEKFEPMVASRCNARFGVAVNSATSALHLACLALDVREGDRVWTSPNSFVASANCARMCGAEVDFVDIDAASGNMSVAALEEKLNSAVKAGKLPKVIIPVHFAGQPCDMAEIWKLAQQYGCKIIEDASHAIGAKYRGGQVGSGQYAEITVFSFHPVKIMTTGEGGIALTNSEELAHQMLLRRSHGITRDSVYMEGDSDDGWYYQQLELGYNYRMTDIQAALGLSQLKRLDPFLAQRKLLADRYAALLQTLPVEPLQRLPERTSAWHLYVLHVEASRRRNIYDGLRAAGIGVNVHYIPIHLQPYYRRLGFKVGDFPEAEKHYGQALSLPLYFGLSEESQSYVVSQLRKVFQESHLN
jgi:UDP-4-amino-4,6-dideoxy-N-acetyl-beta-L-altrosamine transaminase